MAIQHHLCQERLDLLVLLLFVESMLTSIGCVGTSSVTLRVIYSFGLNFRREEKSPAVFILPGMCFIVELKCRTKSLAFKIGGGRNLIWKKRVNGLLSILRTTGLSVP